MDLDKIVSYNDILKYQLNLHKNVKSYRISLATKLGFHPSHLSHVLTGTAHLTHEQGMALCLEWKFKDKLTNLFLNLISLARSETESLKAHYARKIEVDRKNLSAVVTPVFDSTAEGIELDFRQTYIFFSHWRYAATLSHLGIKPMVDLSEVSRRLKLTEEDLLMSLYDLQEMGLVERLENGNWIKLDKKCIPSNDKKAHDVFNQTIRQRGALATDFGGDFTPVRIAQVAVGEKEDLLEIRRIIIETIVKVVDIMGKSSASEDKDPQVIAFCLDLFNM